MRFSIIIPVYNREKILNKCIYSVLGQSFDDFELILVDDGSRDKSLEICNSFAKTDKRVKVITQENTGPSAARNNGLEHATGEYVVFIDSDDYINKDYLLKINDKISKGKPDLIFISFLFENDKYEILGESVLKDVDCIKKEKFSHFIKYLIDNDVFGYTWCKAVKRQIIADNNLMFDTKYSLHEDLLFSCSLVEHSSSISTICEPIYHYIKSNDSLCAKFRSDIMDNMDYVNSKLFDFYRRINIEHVDIMIVQRAVFSVFLILKNSKTKGFKYNSNEEYKRFLKGRNIREINSVRLSTYSRCISGKKKWIVFLIAKVRSVFFFKAVIKFYKTR